METYSAVKRNVKVDFDRVFPLRDTRTKGPIFRIRHPEFLPPGGHHSLECFHPKSYKGKIIKYIQDGN